MKQCNTVTFALGIAISIYVLLQWSHQQLLVTDECDFNDIHYD